MRKFMVTAAVLALMATPTHAQMGGKRHHGDGPGNKQDNKPKADEKAYKAALERIPEPKEKYDPWGVARPTEPTKKSK